MDKNTKFRKTLPQTALRKILDSLPSLVYIVDPDSFEILYANDTLQSAFNKELIGETCYKVLQNLDAPCPFCTTPILMQNPEEPYEWEYRNPVINRDYLIVDRLIQWTDGSTVRFESALDITARKQIETVTRERAQIIDAMGDGLLVINGDGQILEANAAFKEVTKFSCNELIGHNAFEIFSKLLSPDVLSALSNFLEGMRSDEKGSPFFTYMQTTRQEQMYVSITPSKFGSRQDPKIILTIKDLNVIQDAQRKLQESEERFRSAFEQAAVGILHVAPDSRLLRINRQFCDFLGYTEEELQRLGFQDITYPEDLEIDQSLVNQVLKGDISSYDLEKRYIRKDGKIVWAHLHVSLVRDQEGNPKYFVSVVQDIGQRKELEIENEKVLFQLGERVKELRCLYQIGTIIEEYTDLKDIIEQCTEAIPPGFQFPDKTGAKIAVAGFAHQTKNFLDSEPEIDIPIHLRNRLIGKVSVSFAEDSKNAKKTGFLPEEHDLIQAIADRISSAFERSKTRGELMQSEAKYRTLIQNSPQKVFLKDRNSVYLYVNELYASDFEISPDDFIGKQDYEFYPAELAEKYIQDDQRIIQSGETVNLEEKYVKNGQEFWVNTIKTPVWDDDGRLLGIMGIFWDITEKKQAEDRLRDMNKRLAQSNQELEQFAYVASHDLQEPLRMVSSYVQLLARRYKDKLDEDADEFIHYAVDGATRMKNLINDLLLYSRVNTRQQPREFFDSGDVLQKVLGDLKPSIEETSTEIEVGSLPEIYGDPVQIGQVFQNLIGNAVKFRNTNQIPHIKINAVKEDENWVFSVQDNGIGIESQYFEKIFRIFQRLQHRSDYQGTGIGLAVCQRIIAKHGGQIWVESELGGGSTFFFSIPIPNIRVNIDKSKKSRNQVC